MEYPAPQQRRRCFLYIFLSCLLLAGFLAAIRKTSEPPLSYKLRQILSEILQRDGLGKSLQAWTVSNMACARPKSSDIARGAQTVQTFLDIQSPTLQGHRLRYIVVEARGGIFNDPEKIDSLGDPIIPLVQVYARAIVGIQYGQLDDTEPSRGQSDRIVFCQWTVTTKTGRPVPPDTIQAIVLALHRTEKQRESKVSHLQVPTKFVGLVNGPGIWSEIIMESLSSATGTKLSYPNITGLLEPRLFGDILVLPVDTLRMQSGHSRLKMSWRSG